MPARVGRGQRVRNGAPLAARQLSQRHRPCRHLPRRGAAPDSDAYAAASHAAASNATTGYGHRYRHRDSHRHEYRYGDTDRYSDRGCHGNAHTSRYTYSYPGGVRDSDAHAGKHAYADASGAGRWGTATFYQFRWAAVASGTSTAAINGPIRRSALADRYSDCHSHSDTHAHATPTPTPTPTATPTRTPAATPVTTSTAIAATVPTQTGESSENPSGSENRPEFASSLLGIEDISTDAETIATNFFLALLLLLLILFDASIVNATVKENHDFFEGLSMKLTSPFASFFAAVAGFFGSTASSGPLVSVARPALVLGLTSLIYVLLEPDVGFNQPSLVVLLSLFVGIAVTTYTYDGGQVLVARRQLGLPSGILFYPFAIILAVVSVLASRLFDIHPGVVYGFVAAASLLSEEMLPDRHRAQIILVPMLILLAVSLAAWLLLSPLRSWSEDGNFIALVLEAAAVSIFLGGIYGILFNLVPLDFVDGKEIWRWSRMAWLAIALPVTFIFLQVILNPGGDFDSPIQETGLQALLIACIVIWVLTAVVWLFFRQRARLAA